MSRRSPVDLPPPRPVLWALRSPDTARSSFEVLGDGRRRIVIRHAELKGVRPEMLRWWYHNVLGEMDYAGGRWPRYLVWHPLDHISYRIVRAASGGGVGLGARLHIREAFQRKPDNLLDVTVTVERIDAAAAIIGNRILGLSALRLVNSFEATATGTRYVSEMVIGSDSLAGRLGLNRLARGLILPGAKAEAWARHHIEEVGNLENFLPALYAAEMSGKEN
jgi:hypothetical protein